MPPLTPEQWAEVRARVAAGDTPADLARIFGVHSRTIEKRLKRPQPSPRQAPRPGKARAVAKRPRVAPRPRSAGVSSRAPSLALRRQLLNRLYRAIDTKLKLMERRMHSEMTSLDDPAPGNAAPPLSAADHERETRAFGALVKTINSVKDLQAELDHLAKPNATAATPADARFAADAERVRQEIAERLARFVPPGA